MERKIIVVGSINTDLVIKAPYMPAKGETLTGEGFFTAHGGKGANQAVAAARLGGNVVMCGCVGDDTFGKEALDSLTSDGIDTSHIRVLPNTPTGTAVITVVDGDNYIVLERGANACLTKEDIDKTLATANEGDIYLTQLENPIDVIGYGLRRAKEKKLYVILNPAPADRSIGAYLSYVDLVVPNETETEILGGEENILCQTGGELIVTVGSKGFVCYDKKGVKSAYPCIKVKPVDTTAAGDTFCGGLAAKLAMGKPLTDSAKYGSLAASIACTRKGAQPSVPTKEEVEAYIAKNNLEL